MTDRKTKIFTLTTAVFMLLAIFVSCCVESQKDIVADYFYCKGGEYLLAEDYKNAERAYKTAVALKPDNVLYNGGLGAVYISQDSNKFYEVQSQAKENGVYSKDFEISVKLHHNMTDYGAVSVKKEKTENGYIRADYFNADKKTVRQDIYSDDTLLEYSLYLYDEKGLLTEQTDFDSSGEQKSIIRYEYDKQGNQPVKKETYKVDRNFKEYGAVLIEVSHYLDGQLIRLEKHNAVNGRLADIYYYKNDIKYKAEHYLKDADTVYLNSYKIFDDEGKVTEEAYFNRDKTLRVRRKYTLKGADGQKAYIKEEFYGPDDIIAYRLECIYDDKWNTIGHYYDYYDEKGNLEYSTKELPLGNRQITAFPRIEEINPRPLTESEIDTVNRKLYLGKYEGKHILDAFRCLEGIADADDILNYYADDICDMGVVSYKDTDEIEELKKEGLDLEYYLAETSLHSYHRVSYSAVDRFVRKMLGVGIEDSGLLQRKDYSEKYGCFYVMSQSYQEDVVDFECIGGTLSDNWLKLYDRYTTWIFRIDDGNYYPYAYIYVNNSYMLPRETPKPTPSPTPDPSPVQFNKKEVFLTPVAGMSREYNDAMTAFNREIEKITEPYPDVRETGMFQRISYALKDMTGDSIPELFVEYSVYGSMCEVYMYCNGSVKRLESSISDSTVMDSRIYEDGTVTSTYSNLGNSETTCYRYSYDGTRVQLLSFGLEWNYYTEDYDHLINEEKVTKEEYIELLKTFLDENKKLAKLDFEDVWYKAG